MKKDKNLIIYTVWYSENTKVEKFTFLLRRDNLQFNGDIERNIWTARS